jgi:hypothetical protein
MLANRPNGAPTRTSPLRSFLPFREKKARSWLIAQPKGYPAFILFPHQR